MNNICAIPKLKSHHFVPKGIYITVYNNTVTTLQTRPLSSVDAELQMNETDTWSARIEIQCMTASGSA